MDKETLGNVATGLFAVYIVIVLISLLGGGIELSTLPSQNPSTIKLSNVPVYALPIVVPAVAIMVPKGKKSWVVGGLAILGGVMVIFAATYSSVLLGQAIGGVIVLEGAAEIIVQEHD